MLTATLPIHFFNEVRRIGLLGIFSIPFCPLTCTSGPTDWRTFPIKKNASFMNLLIVTGLTSTKEHMQADWVEGKLFRLEKPNTFNTKRNVLPDSTSKFSDKSNFKKNVFEIEMCKNSNWNSTNFLGINSNDWNKTESVTQK